METCNRPQTNECDFGRFRRIGFTLSKRALRVLETVSNNKPKVTRFEIPKRVHFSAAQLESDRRHRYVEVTQQIFVDVSRYLHWEILYDQQDKMKFGFLNKMLVVTVHFCPDDRSMVKSYDVENRMEGNSSCS